MMFMIFNFMGPSNFDSHVEKQAEYLSTSLMKNLLKRRLIDNTVMKLIERIEEYEVTVNQREIIYYSFEVTDVIRCLKRGIKIITRKMINSSGVLFMIRIQNVYQSFPTK